MDEHVSNPAFDELLGLLQERCCVDADGLLRALFAIRAHHSLEAIIPLCARVDTIVRTFPEFSAEPAFGDQTDRLRLIHEIGQLRVTGKSRLGAHRLNRSFSPERALHEWGGDSGLCDLLLEWWKHPASDADRAFRSVQAWFTWQVLQHQARNESLDAYRVYLIGDGRLRLGETPAGRRVADVARALRGLTFSYDAERLLVLAPLLRPATTEHSGELLRILRLVLDGKWKPEQRDLAAAGAEQQPPAQRDAILRLRAAFPIRVSRHNVEPARVHAPDFDPFKELPESLRSHLAPRSVDKRQGGLFLSAPITDIAKRRKRAAQLRNTIEAIRSKRAPRQCLPELKRFLEVVWDVANPKARMRVPYRRRVQRGSADWTETVEYGNGTIALSQFVAGDGVQDGVAVDLYAAPEEASQTVDTKILGSKGKNGPAGGTHHRVVWNDDPEPEAETAVEPQVTIFLATGSVMSGWYAARSAEHHIERENAWLQWPEWRLSDAAIQSVLAWVAHRGSSTTDGQWARLALGVSLVSGRSLSSACSTRVAARSEKAGEDVMRIDARQHLLLAPAGAPHLVSVAPAMVQAYCAPHADTLRLPLPRAWTPLVDQLAGREPPSLDTLHGEVERALASFPPDAAITQKGVSHALKLALLDRGCGDLGLVKAITNADGVNFGNIIHYASYDRGAAEKHWRSIVGGWAGPLHAAPDEPPPADPIVIRDEQSGHGVTLKAGAALGARVGTPYCIDPTKVAPGVAMLKAWFGEAVSKERWADVNNLLTMYVAAWLGLATAGRAAQEPVPCAILESGWTLVRDKHRPDESTDRYLPLSDRIRAQLESLRDFTAVLGLANEAFKLPRSGADHLLHLRLVRPDGRVVPFHPADLADGQPLHDLPGNWARKVVRACTFDLPGRFLDAGLGHWVRGRHPWTLTSTFPAAEFRDQWLSLQARLEQQLGFEVLSVPGLPRYAIRSAPPAPRRVAQSDVTPHAPKESEQRDAEVAALLANCHGELWHDRVFKQTPPDANAALELAKWAVGHAGDVLGDDLAANAERVCTYIRKKTKIPLFATRPRGRFQHNWLVNRSEFEALDYVERWLLPAIEKDLQTLPSLKSEFERIQFAYHWMDKIHQERIWRNLRVGRLIVALALRAGLVTTVHLDAFLQMLAGSTPLLAIGDTRVVELSVLSRRARDPMCRIVMLEPYLAALIASERDAVGPWLQRLRHDPKLWRHAEHWNAALRAYLHGLGLPAELTLSMFLAGIRQRIQLRATPLLAAYASGEILTQDLSLQELARLAGCELPDGFGKSPSLSASGAPDRRRERRSGAVHYQRRHADLTRQERVQAMKLAVADPLPEDVEAGEANLPARLTRPKSRDPRAWSQLIAHQRDQMPEKSLNRLLCAFAADLVTTYQYRGGHRDKGNDEANAGEGDTAALFGPKQPPRRKLSPRFRSWARSHLDIVWAGLAGFSAVLGNRPYIDESVVQALAESTESYFPSRRQRAAWSRFRYFLMNPRADHAGFEVGTVETGRLRVVSAKILTRPALDRAAAYLDSVRSGLGAVGMRSIACRHFEVARATGARRAEAAGIRWADVDGNCVRIRPYAGHTLKTPASERIVPAQVLDGDVWRHLKQGKVSDAAQFIAGTPSEGANFFDAEAKAIKYGAGDIDLSPHHLRHTKANALLLKVLSNCVDIGRLKRDFPWVEGVLPPDSELGALLGRGGQCGQGLQATAMLLGHLHPTTTLKHYLHTLCLALYAYQLGQEPIPLHRAFGNRVKSRATLYRYAKRASGPAEAARAVLGRIEADAEGWHRGPKHRSPLVVSMLPTPRRDIESAPTGDEERASQRTSKAMPEHASVPDWTVAELEEWQRHFATGKGAPPNDAEAMLAALQAIATIPSGKRGSCTPRHPLPTHGKRGLRLPAMIRSAAEVGCAQQLLDWLAELRATRPEDYAWLLDKWLYASEAQEGLMRLGSSDVERARSLPRTMGVLPEIRAGHISARRINSGATAGMRLRIQLERNGADSEPEPADPSCGESSSNQSQYAGRTTRAIRWAFTWLAARRGGVKNCSET